MIFHILRMMSSSLLLTLAITLLCYGGLRILLTIRLCSTLDAQMLSSRQVFFDCLYFAIGYASYHLWRM
jgi:hypothetical protein